MADDKRLRMTGGRFLFCVLAFVLMDAGEFVYDAWRGHTSWDHAGVIVLCSILWSPFSVLIWWGLIELFSGDRSDERRRLSLRDASGPFGQDSGEPAGDRS